MDCDVVLNGITGAVGLRPTLAALDAGEHARAGQQGVADHRRAAGHRARRSRGRSCPSTPSTPRWRSACAAGAPARCAGWCSPPAAARSAAGSREELHDVTLEQALAHPTWAMGPVVTINSATLVNKGLEVIEAHLLFDIPLRPDRGRGAPARRWCTRWSSSTTASTLAQARPPDMLIPIALGLGWPDRVPDAAPPVDWARAQAWEFFPLDDEAFPAVRLAREAGARGGTAPAVYNAANEVCVEAFLAGRAAVHRHRRPRSQQVLRASRTYARTVDS